MDEVEPLILANLRDLRPEEVLPTTDEPLQTLRKLGRQIEVATGELGVAWEKTESFTDICSRIGLSSKAKDVLVEKLNRAIEEHSEAEHPH